ncbi:hypothetical protein [Niallia endozanthoxylica]|uniref:Uncharacterized protein n=1 Tax=Niallia endozanthoxylica TaxID=2036016 RepID=A0A5J5HN13_9BACI|nr:hypothetical protein [Niallia endozanthoxylica]KAA9021746.1 hypothetical protein F4V44_17380 [Niallia endozanthoxylica]
MMLRIILMVLLLFFVTACNAENQTTKEDASASSYNREMTDEEQTYIDYILKEDYETLISITQNRESELKNDYYRIALGLKLYEEVEIRKKELDVTNEEIELRYSTILFMLDRVKFIPAEIKDKVKEVKKLSQYQKDYYANKQL